MLLRNSSVAIRGHPQRFWLDLVSVSSQALCYGIIAVTLGFAGCHSVFQTSKPRSFNRSTPEAIANKPKQNRQDLAAISRILEAGDFLNQIKAWNGKILIVKFDPDRSPNEFRYYNYQTDLTSDRKSIQSPSDRGFFNPASTVKVSLAALALEKLNRLGFSRESEYQIAGTSSWYRIDDDIRRALVLSDNEAANRLILWVGFDSINQQLKQKGVKNLTINRLMLNRRTLVNSPAFNLRHDRLITQSTQTVSIKSSCYETESQIGNCATAIGLVGVLNRLVQPEYFTATERFNLNPSNQAWLQMVMSHTPL